MRSNPILYRGFNVKMSGPITHVVEDRPTFKGNLENVTALIEKLKKDKNFISPNPTFVSTSYDKAKFFGAPYIFIPKNPYRLFQNPNIDDLWSNNDTISADDADGYNDVTGNYSGAYDELIADSKDYYLLSSLFIMGTAPEELHDFPSYLNKWFVEKLRGLKTYEDVLKIAEEWKNK